MREVRMPLQLFPFLVSSSAPRSMVGRGFLRSESPSFVLSAAETALKCGSSSPAPKTLVSNSMISSRPRLAAVKRRGKSRSTHTGSGDTPRKSYSVCSTLFLIYFSRCLLLVMGSCCLILILKMFW